MSGRGPPVRGERYDSRDRTGSYGGGARHSERYDDEGRYDDGDAGFRGSRNRFDDEDEPLGTSKIWIGGCPPDISERDIERVCSRFGLVHTITIKTSSRDTFSFVQYGNEREARDAIRSLDQTQPFGGGMIKVATANRKFAPDVKNNREGSYNSRERRGDCRRDSREAGRGDRDRGCGERARSYDRGRGEDRGYRRDVDGSYKRGADRKGNGRTGGASYSHGGSDPGGGRQPSAGYQDRRRVNSRSPPHSGVDSKRSGQANRPVKVYISQLPRDMDEAELLEVASEYGEVLSHSLERQGAYKFGCVEYKRKSEAIKAIQELDDRQMQGWHMRLQAYIGRVQHGQTRDPLPCPSMAARTHPCTSRQQQQSRWMSVWGAGNGRNGGASYSHGGSDPGGGRQPSAGYQDRRRANSRSPPHSGVDSKRSGQVNRPVKVYISQLPRDMDEEELLEVASEYGDVLSHSLERQGAYKFGYVEYKRKSEAIVAIRELDDRQMQGWHMRLQAYMYPTG